MKRLIMGVGIKDITYKVKISRLVGNKNIVIWRCPYYNRWEKMLKRCYSNNYHLSNPTYKDCTVCEEWLTFSNFRGWMEKQQFEGMELDKDILTIGNKVYSPTTCVFVHKKVNAFLLEGGSSKELPLGVSWHRKDKKFRARARNPISGCAEYLGNFSETRTAHIAWCNRKLKFIDLLVEEGYCTEGVISEALRYRFEFMKDNIEGLLVDNISYQEILDKQM